MHISHCINDNFVDELNMKVAKIAKTCFGSHLGCYLEYPELPKGANVAPTLLLVEVLSFQNQSKHFLYTSHPGSPKNRKLATSFHFSFGRLS